MQARTTIGSRALGFVLAISAAVLWPDGFVRSRK